MGLVAAALAPLVSGGAPAAAQSPAPAPIESVQLSLLGAHNLAAPGLDGQVKPRGQNGDVAVLGRTAFVAAGPIFHGANSSTGRICTDHGGVKVVDLTDPSRPVLVSTITVEDTKGVPTRGGAKFDNVSVTASAVDARSVSTPTFTGDVVAIATQRCEPSFFTGARIEFWDVTNRAAPSRIGVFDPANITFGTRTGAWGIFEDVRMFTRGDRLMALATTPFSIGNAHDASPFGDLRVIDATDLRNPQQVGTFPPVSLGQNSVNGCRTFQAGRAAAPTPDGNGAILSWYDGTGELSEEGTAAVFKLDLDNLPRHVAGTSPPKFDPSPPFWGYPYDGDVEGNAADVEPFLGPSGELQVLLSEDDIDPALTSVAIGAGGATPQQYRGCTILAGKHLYEYPNQQLSAEIVYVGRACPASTRPGTTNTVAEELLADPAGKIAVVEGGGNQFDGCSAVEKLDRLKAEGALAILQSTGSEALNTVIAGPRGGVPSLPYLTVPKSAYDNVQLVPTPVVGGNLFPSTWERTSDTNVTVVAFPGRSDKRRFKSVADAADRVARAQVATAARFPVAPGTSYQASAFLELEAIAGGTFRAAVVWYDAGGTALGEQEIASLAAVNPRARFERSVTAPAGAVKGAVKVEWAGGDTASGTAYADTISLVRPGLQSTLRDERGEWGAQRVLNFSANPPTEAGTYRSPTSTVWPPPDNGLYAPRLARMFGKDVAFTTWMSDGLRVVDVSDPSRPREVGSFVPAPVADPTPQAGAGAGLTRGPVWGDRTLVTGVDVIPTSDSSGIVVISDINAGLYVLGFQLQRSGELAPGATITAAPGEAIRLVGTGFAPGATVRLSSSDSRDLGTATADGSGSFAAAISLPVDIGTGTHRIHATGAAAAGGVRTLVYNLVVPAMGYWTVASDGGVFSFGNAVFQGSTGG
ncbi:MAG: selenium-binding family protein, partial [Actinobacteria bacterium]|nr:selenium-binding family protein [Actinomycetota bacterium]